MASIASAVGRLASSVYSMERTSCLRGSEYAAGIAGTFPDFIFFVIPSQLNE